MGLVVRGYVLLTCDYVTTSKASSSCEMRAVRNPHPYILLRFPVINVLLAVCHHLQIAYLCWQLAEQRSREYDIASSWFTISYVLVSVLVGQHILYCFQSLAVKNSLIIL